MTYHHLLILSLETGSLMTLLLYDVFPAFFCLLLGPCISAGHFVFTWIVQTLIIVHMALVVYGQCLWLCIYGYVYGCVFMAMGMDVCLWLCVYGFVWTYFWMYGCVFMAMGLWLCVWVSGLDPSRGPIHQISGLTSPWSPFPSSLGLILPRGPLPQFLDLTPPRGPFPQSLGLTPSRGPFPQSLGLTPSRGPF